ncbi:hypothetical protein Lesp02_30640 [Lentzea sp. NBRC 105346]|uniref:hypothetical protein n=1 Tax=Lentzea sp. NBRC 105346 TaxID=3032205 RepID=UPI0024A17166|nr:hypothetical protein [Lentzea sp. NBRC 105346]GLZ30875.1 hypothetical protein Lesp02_30640 [Lentzea sp. NBRC 105346]
MFTEVQILIARLHAELDRLRHDEAGYSTEAVVVTALLVTLALSVIAVIAVKVAQKASGINL